MNTHIWYFNTSRVHSSGIITSNGELVHNVEGLKSTKKIVKIAAATCNWFAPILLHLVFLLKAFSKFLSHINCPTAMCDSDTRHMYTHNHRGYSCNYQAYCLCHSVNMYGQGGVNRLAFISHHIHHVKPCTVQRFADKHRHNTTHTGMLKAHTHTHIHTHTNTV